MDSLFLKFNSRLLVVIMLCALPKLTTAQTEIGLGWGVNINLLTTNTNARSYSIEPRDGYNLSLFVSKYVTSRLLMEVAINHVKKNYALFLTDKRHFTTNYTNKYIEIPLKVNYVLRTWKAFELLAGAGFFIGQFNASTEEGSIPNIFPINSTIEYGHVVDELGIIEYKQKLDLSSGMYNRFEFGLLGNIRLLMPLYTNLTIGADLSYNHSLSSINNPTFPQSSKMLNRTSSLNFLIKFQL